MKWIHIKTCVSTKSSLSTERWKAVRVESLTNVWRKISSQLLSIRPDVKLPTCFFRAGGHWTHNRNCTLRMNVMFIYFLWLPRIIVKSLLTHWMLTSVVKCDTRHTPTVSSATRWVAAIVIEACKFIDTSLPMIDIEMSRYGLQEIWYWQWRNWLQLGKLISAIWTLYSKEFDILIEFVEFLA